MTSRGKSHIGFGSGDTKSIGGKFNTNFKDMDSLLSDLNSKHDGNSEANFGFAGGKTTLNVQKMVLTRPTPTRYEQNRAQFESLLRQTLQS